MRKHILGLIILLLLAQIVDASHAQEITPLPIVTEADGKLGTCYAFYDIEGELLTPLAYTAGSRWDRFDFRWNVIEDTRDNFDFTPHDTVVNRDTTNGLDVVGILGSTAKWAASDCPQKIRQNDSIKLPMGHPPLPQQLTDDLWWRPCPPDNLYLPWNHPDNAWGNYVYQTVTHFKDRVHVWEIWNEPDLGTVFWSGTTAEYAQLLKVGYQAVKAADPEATVLFAGLAYWSNPTYYVQVLDEVLKLEGAADNNYYFDTMSLHLYSNIYNIGYVAAQIQENMTTRVGPHPIWLTETGVMLWDEHPTHPGVPYQYAATIEEAAAYMLEGFAEARAAGIEKFFYFRLHDEAMSESFGLIRNDKTLRPAYIALQVAARYLRNENQVTGPFNHSSGTRRVTFLGAADGRIDVLWNTRGSDTITYTHPAILPTATLIDHYGQTQTLQAHNGYFTVTLEPATANLTPDSSYMIGGSPLLLLQEDKEAPTSTLHQPPVMLYTDKITLTWDAADQLSGYWYEEIQRAPTPQGPWALIAGWEQTNELTQTVIPLPLQGTNYQPWYFRARARDKAGHWEGWPETAEVDTDFSMTRTVVLTATVQSELAQTVVLPLPDVTITWEAPNGEVVTQTTGMFSPLEESLTIIMGVPWVVTKTVVAGEHHLRLEQADHFTDRVPFMVLPGEDIQHIVIHHTMRLIPSKIYLPVVMRNHN